MLLSSLRDAIGDRLETISGLTVSTYRPSAVAAPHAVVSIASGAYDATMGRGSDTITVQIIVLVTRADDPEGLRLLDDFVAGHGTRSVKTAVEAATGTGLSFVRVTGYEVGTTSVPDGAEYLAATFECEAVISGTT